MKFGLSLLAALCFAASTAHSHEYTKGDLQIIHPHSAATISTAKSGVGYLAISNLGVTDDRLIEIRSSVGNAMLHTTEVSADGIARMTHLENGILLPVGETVVLEPGGLHVMFFGLTEPFIEGQSFAATLVFEHAGETEIEFQIEPADPAPHDHSTAKDGS